MLLRNTNRNARSRLYSKVTLGVLFIVALLFAHGVWGVYTKAYLASERRTHAESELEELLEKQESLTEGIRRLETERGIEEEIREKYRMVKEGEEMVVIIDEVGTQEEQTAVALPATKGVFGRFLEKIF